MKTKDRRGVHGVRVGLGVEIDGVEHPLGQALTRADGRFRIHVDAGDLPRGRRALVAVGIVDRRGNRVHSGVISKRPGPSGVMTIDVDVDEVLLAGHVESPTAFESAVEPLVRATEMIRDVEAAIGSFIPPGDPRFEPARRAVLCPDPPFELLDHLALESLGVLAGDPLAGGRFRETVELLQSGPGGHVHSPMSDWTPPAARHDATSAVRPTVPPERVAPILAAAAYLDGGAGTGEGGLLGAVLGRVCEIEAFGFLHRAAVDAVRSDAARLRFEGILRLRGFDDCGPIDQPLPPMERPHPRCDPVAAFYLECARQVATAFRTPVPTYTVTGVTPARACAGRTITIAGNGFGDDAGTVVFNRRGGGQIEVTASSWSDTAIRVVVPADATCGLGLTVYERTDEVCGRFVDVYRRARFDADFEGSAAEVQDLRVNGRDGSGICVRPGAPINITWQTCAADTVAVKVEDLTGFDRATSARPDGSLALTAPTSGPDQEWTVTVAATGTCSPATDTRTLRFLVAQQPDLQIRGVEVTQAIQHYRASGHLTDAADRGATNSLPLVVGKRAWVRVYLRSGVDGGWNNGELGGVTGRLTVSRIVGGSPRFVAAVDPTNAPVTARAAYPIYRTERGDATTTLNFVIPAAEVTGRLRLDVEVFADTACFGRTSDRRTVEVDVARLNRLRLRGVPFSFNPPAGSTFTALGAPTLPQLRQDAGLAYAMWPVARPRTQDISVTAAQSTSLPLNDPRVGVGGCSNNWSALLNQLSVAAANDGPRPNTVYYAYLPAGMPVNVPGCGTGGQGGGRRGDTLTMAHEIGHGLGRPHSPCNVTGDNNYPVYQPYDSVVAPITPTNPNVQLALTSIGEFGLDPRNGTIFDPQNTADVMSYCGPNNWTSKYVHRIVYGASILNPQTVPVGAAAVSGEGVGDRRIVDKTPVIAIWGTWTTDDRVDISTVMRLETVPEEGPGTPLTAELIGGDGEVLAAAKVVARRVEGCGCGGSSNDTGTTRSELPVLIRADVPDIALGAGLRIRRGKDVLWERSAPEKPPRVEDVTARVQKDGRVRLRWKATVARGQEARAWITCTTPDGKDHQGLATEVTGDRIDLDLSDLPGGPTIFGVRVTDGYSAAAAASDVVDCPRRQPTATIMHPTDGQVIPAEGAMIALEALTGDADDVPLPDCSWELDGKIVATADDAVIPTPSTGRHTLVLRAGPATDQVTFVVAPPAAEPPVSAD